MTYLILSDGIPFFYAGFETGQAGAYPNYNRDPLWPAKWVKSDTYNFVALLNKARNGVINKDGDAFLTQRMTFLYTAGNALAFKRGSMVVFVTNVGSSGADLTIVTSDSGFPHGTEMVDFVAGGTVTVGAGGAITVTLSKGMPVVLYPKTDFAQVVLTTTVNALAGESTVANGTDSGTDSGTATGTAATATGSKATSTAKSLAIRIRAQKGLIWTGVMALGVAFGAGYFSL